MPILILVLAVLFGVEYASPRDDVSPPVAAATHPSSSWALECQAKLEEAARSFEGLSPSACTHGTVELSVLPSGVDYVEYNFTTPAGTTYQVMITEEPQNVGEATGWRGFHGCHTYDAGFEMIRHDNGRLARVSASGGPGRDFAQIFSFATDDCIAAK